MKFEGSIEFSIIKRTDNRVVSEMAIRAGIKNPFGVVHVGAFLWLADVTATFLVMGSAQASEGMKGFPLAITLNANFISHQTDGMFTGRFLIREAWAHGQHRSNPCERRQREADRGCHHQPCIVKVIPILMPTQRGSTV